MGRHSTAVRLLDPKVEQLEADVAADRYDLSQLSDEVPGVNFPMLIKMQLIQETDNFSFLIVNANSY